MKMTGILRDIVILCVLGGAFIAFLFLRVDIPVPTVEDGVYLRNTSGIIDVGSWSVPYVYDWDSDGRKDLLVGYRDGEHGYVSFLRNMGTDDNPLLSEPEILKAGNEYIDLQPEG